MAGITEMKLDSAIRQVLAGCKVVGFTDMSDKSDWASVAQIDTRLADGSEKSFFYKILTGDDAEARVLGEYMSMSEIYKTLPSIAPEPIGYGKCRDEDSHYFICEFVPIGHPEPDATKLGKSLADLHSPSKSPPGKEGKFGFGYTTFDGAVPIKTDWNSSWTSFFTEMLRDLYKRDEKVNGTWEPLATAMNVAIDKTIPRLLDALVASGRSITPTLIHGDLWEGNIGTSSREDRIYIFDAAVYYAHHEMELGIWRCEHQKIMNKVEYRDEYFKHMEISAPVEEADDRARLYSVKTLLVNSILFPGAETRQKAADELKWLMDKYSITYDIKM